MMRLGLFAAVVAAATAAPSTLPHAATGAVTVDAVYEISLAGWGIARANLDLKIQNGNYDASIFMAPKGVAKIVTAVQTSVSAAGEVNRGRVQPKKYSVRAKEIARPVAVDMTLRSGSVTNLKAVPPLAKRPGRVAVTAQHKRGIVDPLSSVLLPIRTSDGSDACGNRLKIFDGWTRYDVKLYRKGKRQVSTEGYSGPVVVCGARWVPVSGHRPAKKEVQYLANNKALEMWVVPIPSEGVAIPYRVTIGTPNGEIKVEPSRLVISGTGV